jgi:hypothetical protein
MVMAKRGGYCLLSNSMYHLDQVRLRASRRLIYKIVKLNKGESRDWKLVYDTECESHRLNGSWESWISNLNTNATCVISDH